VKIIIYLMIMNDFEIDKIPFGAGSFGTVFRGRRKSDGLDVCIKMSKKKLTPEERQLTEREIQVVSILKHPNILQSSCHVYEEGHLCIVMELADGKDLSSFIGSPLQEEQVLQIFTQIVIGLHYMHQCKIAHGNLKPGNIFLKNGIIKIGDFGLPRIVENTLIANTTIAGRLYYMIPQLLTGKEWGISTDIWSLGCILYQMMSGKLPFQQNDLQSLIQMISTLSPEPLPEQYSGKLKHLVHLF
jgi:serine/threonine protein kinase